MATVTLTGAVVDVLAAASQAFAASVCAPLSTRLLSHVYVYGGYVTAAPRGLPSSRNCTPDTPTLSPAAAATSATPDTLAPAAGAVRLTVGACASGVLTILTMLATDGTPLPLTTNSM